MPAVSTHSKSFPPSPRLASNRSKKHVLGSPSLFKIHTVYSPRNCPHPHQNIGVCRSPGMPVRLPVTLSTLPIPLLPPLSSGQGKPSPRSPPLPPDLKLCLWAVPRNCLCDQPSPLLLHVQLDGQWHRGHPESPPTHPGLQPRGACKPGFPKMAYV